MDNTTQEEDRKGRKIALPEPVKLSEPKPVVGTPGAAMSRLSDEQIKSARIGLLHHSALRMDVTKKEINALCDMALGLAELERERDLYRQQWAYADDAYEAAEAALAAERQKVAELEHKLAEVNRELDSSYVMAAETAERAAGYVRRYEKAEARAARLEKALRELVRLKGLHDEIERLEQKLQVNRVYFMKATYAAEKPLAWAAARAELQEGPKEGTL